MASSYTYTPYETYRYSGGFGSTGYRTRSNSFPYVRSVRSYSQPRKKSGCTIRIMEDGAPVISGWLKRRNGLMSLYARPYKGSKQRTSKSGKTWLNVFVTLVNKQTMQEVKTSGLLNLDNHKLYIKSFNLVANPKAPNGGYFGTHISKKR